jgi:hypothetical protein
MQYARGNVSQLSILQTGNTAWCSPAQFVISGLEFIVPHTCWSLFAVSLLITTFWVTGWFIIMGIRKWLPTHECCQELSIITEVNYWSEWIQADRHKLLVRMARHDLVLNGLASYLAPGMINGNHKNSSVGTASLWAEILNPQFLQICSRSANYSITMFGKIVFYT